VLPAGALEVERLHLAGGRAEEVLGAARGGQVRVGARVLGHLEKQCFCGKLGFRLFGNPVNLDGPGSGCDARDVDGRGSQRER
jgi:hypothetical protein